MADMTNNTELAHAREDTRLATKALADMLEKYKDDMVQVTKLRENLHVYFARTTSLRLRVDQDAEVIDTLTNENEALKMELAEARENIRCLENNVRSWKDLLGDKYIEIASLMTENEEIKEAMVVLNGRYNEMKTALNICVANFDAKAMNAEYQEAARETHIYNEMKTALNICAANFDAKAKNAEYQEAARATE